MKRKTMLRQNAISNMGKWGHFLENKSTKTHRHCYLGTLESKSF